jgi:hypothetical protein
MSGYLVSPGDWPAGKPALSADEAEKVLDRLDRVEELISAHPAQQEYAATKESRGTSDDWKARALRAESALAAIETLCRDFDVRSNYQPTYEIVARRIRATIAAALTEET